MTVKALGRNYFRLNKFPINLSRVDRKEHLTHAYDLTEKEHYHDFIELVFILNGQGRQVLEDNEYLVAAGDVFVLQGNQKHYFRDASQVEIVNVMFDGINHPGMIPGKIRQMEGYKALFILEPFYRAKHHFKNRLRLNREELAKIELMLNAMFFEQNQQQEGYELILANRLQELIILLSRQYSNIETTQARALVRIGKVIEYLENNLSETVYIDKLSDMACMSKRNFMRIFKGAVGLSPIQYLRQVRLQRASKMLRESSEQIGVVAMQCGFSDSNYFIKCFRQAFGTTPYRFRMRFNNDTSHPSAPMAAADKAQ